jgi:octaprenyl-diphosphate synthase
MGKSKGNDLREGKPTLPLIYFMARGTSEQVTLAREALEQNLPASKDRFEQLLVAVSASGALDDTLKAAQNEAAKAIEALAPLPNSLYKESLLELCAHSAARQS